MDRGLQGIAALAVVAAVACAPLARAENRPISELPDDVARWSTLWGEIPAQMYEVGVDHGPVAAVTWGPAKGAVVMVEAAARDVWRAAKPEKRPGHASLNRKQGSEALFRYEF